MLQFIKLTDKTNKKNSKKLFSSRSYCDVGRFRSYIVHFGTIEKKLKNHKIPTFTDNKSLHDVLQSSNYFTDKRLRVNMGVLKEIDHNRETESTEWMKFHNKSQTHLKHGTNSLPLIEVLQKYHF